MAHFLFWIFLGIIAYVYFGYPLLLLILSKWMPASALKEVDYAPTISLIIAAYNEEKTIARKIENTMAINYPRSKLEIIVVSDGSTDRTEDIVKEYGAKGIKLVSLCQNSGKSSAQNQGEAMSSGDIIFFTDADVMLHPDALKILSKRFSDGRVGCVVGRIVYVNKNETSVSEGESKYWEYELYIRERESNIGNFAMGSGSMALRRELFQPLSPDVGEDFVLPMQIAMKGYRVIYEPDVVSETFLLQNRPTSMVKSKIRLITKDLRGLFLCKTILNPFRHPLYSWGLVSHKLLRWLVPCFLILLFAVNALLLAQPIYYLTFALQLIFYSSALTGYLWQKSGKPPKIFGIPFSFCLVNFAALVAIGQFFGGMKSGKWTPVR